MINFNLKKISHMVKKHKIKQEFCESVLTKRRKHTANLEIEFLLPHLQNKKKLLKNLKNTTQIEEENITE